MLACKLALWLAHLKAGNPSNRVGRGRAGQTASLVSKYRPPMPILTLVIPTLKNDGMKWTLVGRGVARQCQIQRGLLPVLAAPSPSGEACLHSSRGDSLSV